jgi:OmcA/MtrC family decaheme c-type cytochrome
VITRGERSRRLALLAGALAACALAGAGCKKPEIGGAVESAQGAGGPAIRITGATVDGTGHLVVAFELTDAGAPVATREAALALEPLFTLAALSRHPVDGLWAWRSLLLTGNQTLATLRPGGPGTPAAEVRTNQKQPGAEGTGTVAGADGAFTYRFSNPLPAGFDPTETLRVGVWLLGNGTEAGTSTFDFRPAGGTPAPRDTVLPRNCESCHDVLVSPGGAVGVKMCTTCHTWQNADPDTSDPAALDGATGTTDPNPLDLGRMVHRIHRGRNLPTLHASSSSLDALPLTPPPTDPGGSPKPPPFARPFVPGVNAPIVGRKYSIVGAMSEERVFGRVVTRTDNGVLPGRTVATGVVFPRDLRDCAVCHGGAPQEYEVLFGISRRTCAGCHPEIWFEASPITDAVHFAHPGGPQADDTQCAGCHVAATVSQPKVWAPLAQIHVPPYLSPSANMPRFEIVSVSNLKAGLAPKVVFKMSDAVGPIVPTPRAPVPATDTRPNGSPLSRRFSTAYPSGAYLAIAISGPTSPDYAGPPSAQVISTAAGNPDIYALTADPVTNEYTYQFVSTLPEGAAGTWTVAMEGYRTSYQPSVNYHAASNEFRWPYTSEALSEASVNPLVDVDTATGEWSAANPGTTVPRRAVVTQERCERCHGRLALHGTMRNRVEHCVTCHTATATDWSRRPKGAGGDVNLAATFDGVEERSVHFKVLIHRIHTGGREGSGAGLSLLDPVVVYGYGGTPYFFDEGIFPADLRNCTRCHEGRTYEIDAIPAGAPATVANETATIRHAGAADHAAGERAVPPIQAACMGCHATGATLAHVARNGPQGGVEVCGNCHVRGAVGVDVAHGLVRPGATPIASTWSSIVQNVIAPRCASAACHGGNPPTAFPQLDADAARAAMVDVPSQQASGMDMIEPFDPGASYLVLKLRGEAASAGGVATPMPIGDAMLDPSDIAAIEAWIANGAPND